MTSLGLKLLRRRKWTEISEIGRKRPEMGGNGRKWADICPEFRTGERISFGFVRTQKTNLVSVLAIFFPLHRECENSVMQVNEEI